MKRSRRRRQVHYLYRGRVNGRAMKVVRQGIGWLVIVPNQISRCAYARALRLGVLPYPMTWWMAQ